MTRAALALALLAACDLGLGSDPATAPRSACAPGHARAGDHGGCFVPAHAIAIDGDVDDWSALPAIPLTASCAAPPCDGLLPATAWLAAGPGDDTDADLFVRGSFGAAPPSSDDTLRVSVVVSASPLRPAVGGSDRLVATANALAYVKGAYAVAVAAPVPYGWRWTADGFESRFGAAWLFDQGAARVAITVERAGAGSAWTPVASSAPIDVCWGFRTGPDALPATACEATPR